MDLEVVDARNPTAATGEDAIVELRRYRLHREARDRLIDLFDRAFVEPQEEVGMRVIGQFRDLDDPDSFVWLRGFADMATRAEALAAFYGGPVWAAHRDQANGTMINSDNVLLLRPAQPGDGFPPAVHPRAAIGQEVGAPGLIVATICSLAPQKEDAFASFFKDKVRPQLEKAGARIFASFVTERSPNTFPRLPVREGETVFVWFSGFADLAAYDHHLAALAASEAWVRTVDPEFEQWIWRPREISRLVPTARSSLRA
ncbi:NIPSNAP family protein [Microvirga puerhi]|uniref:NIPSNAP family protein n=1 Tax=Microvirga puerhi TaxID=2876078 RepID=A0ABS7VQR0_9HYPH|nr:NIPSNAP family protein [Microvirga puerhi]MBZ6077292.1 NIPSNAP family protein [Microvirga puerhi]